MPDLTYKTPIPPRRPFAKGDKVHVLDRDHQIISTVAVVEVSPGRVKTDCGRKWTHKGWWLGEVGAWPFPSIRHVRA